MESQDRLHSYSDVNKEIQALIASKENSPPKDTVYRSNDTQDILTLLESLNRTYNEINAALRTENSQALKDVVLKSDIKMSMVCETLLDTLKKTTEEKNSLLRENQNLERMRREYEAGNMNTKMQMDKLRSELEFRRINVDELNRIIQDQKSRMSESKEEAFKARNEVMFFKAKIDELENLRNRANERMGLYEKEMDALNVVIKDKDERIFTLSQEKRQEEEKNASVKTRITELESLLEILNKKLEMKDKNLALCNSELSKVLCENKKYKVEYEKYKESSVYYEGLYNNLNAQNAYLNTELSRILKVNEYSKDIEGCIAKFKKKLSKKRRAIKKLESENKMLKGQVDELSEATVADASSDALLKRLEELNTKNEKFRKQISELENEKRMLESRVRDNVITEPRSCPPRPTFTAPTRQPTYRSYNPTDMINQPDINVKYGNHPAINPKYNSIFEPRQITDPGSINYQQHPSRPNLTGIETDKSKYYLPRSQYTMPIKEPALSQQQLASQRPLDLYSTGQQRGTNPSNDTYLKLFNLENEYEDKPNDRNDFIGGFIKDSDLSEPKLAMEYKGTAPGESVQMQNNLLASKPVEHTKDNDNASAESVKSYHTSSTLKEMMARTDKLQKKFQDLESKLAQINEGESIDRLTDKIKTYNSYYSDWNADSNDSDYI